MEAPAIDIRPLERWDEYLECERLQQEVWRSPDARDVVPAHLLITVQKNAGLVLGAYRSKAMAGFVFGFLGGKRGDRGMELWHCSHMLGVLPEYRNRGLGFALKQRQRDYALAQGLSLMTWTFDPLQAVNARLNLTRLGAVALQYRRDAYGEMQDRINAGVSSDRFQAEWWLNSSRARDRAAAGGVTGIAAPEWAQRLHRVAFDGRSFPYLVAQEEPSDENCLAEIPTNWGKLKEHDLGLARSWREATRRTFEAAFSKGWIATELVDWRDEQGRARSGYLMKRDELSPFQS